MATSRYQVLATFSYFPPRSRQQVRARKGDVIADLKVADAGFLEQRGVIRALEDDDDDGGEG